MRSVSVSPEAAGLLMQTSEIGVYLTDTLKDPTTQKTRGLFGDAKILADADEKARKIKADQPITVRYRQPRPMIGHLQQRRLGHG
ncbi:hypothetical protein GS909_18620 [Rhodococcus hoagii]|nr:hypothetical protein [Prescottella equi]